MFLFIAGIIKKLINQYITILDTQDLIIDFDQKMENKINYKNNNNNNAFQLKLNSNNKKYFNRNDIIQSLIFQNNENNIDKNILNNSEKRVKYSYSIGAKYAKTNNLLLSNNNEILNVLNRNQRWNTQHFLPINKKTNDYKPIKKISFNFLEYLDYMIFNNKRNKVLIYESFRKKIISEEQLIQNYKDIFKLLNVFPYKKNEFKIKDEFNMSFIIRSIVLLNKSLV